VIYFLQGTESFLFDRAVEDIAEKTQIPLEEIVYYSAQETLFSAIMLEMKSEDIFGANKLIILKHLEQQKLSEYLAGLNDDDAQMLAGSQHTLVLYFWREEALSKTLQKELAPLLNRATRIDAKKQKEKDVITMMKQALSKRDYRLSGHDFTIIAQKYQNNLALIHHEINRILLSKDKNTTITVDDFKTDTQFLEEQVFVLIEGLEKRDVDHVAYLLDNILLHQQNVFGLLALLLKNYKEMYQIQALAQRGVPLQEITTKLSLHPYRAKLLFAKTKTLNDVEFEFILNKIIATEIELKRGKQQPLALRELCLQIMTTQIAV